MSDQDIGSIFYAVALPMCMLVLAYLYWNYICERDQRQALASGGGVSALRMAGALRDVEKSAA